MKKSTQNKRLFLVILTIYFSVLYVLAGCSISNVSTPNVEYSETLQMVYWSVSSNASYYVVSINDEEVTIDRSFYFLSNLDSGSYNVKVKAISSYGIESPYSDEMTVEVEYSGGYVWGGESITISSVESLVNVITENYIKGTFKILAKPYNISGGGIFTRTKKYGTISQGSGVIYKMGNDGKYYVLTNNHVIDKSSQYQYIEYELLDYMGNSFSEVSLVGSSKDYDLAVLKFNPVRDGKSYDFPVFQLADSNPLFDEKVVAISTPQGQINAITFGTVLGYEVLDVEDSSSSNITFKVLKHNTPIGNGSSGSALINYDLKICGINYAAGITSGGNTYSYAIPVEKVREFLETIQ